VVLAQALAQGAPVLILDEPTTHLDLRHVLDLLGIVRGLAARDGTAVLAILHDLNLASSVCDRLVVIDHGAIVAEGSPDRVVTAALLREVYGVEADVVTDDRSGRPAVRLGPPHATAPRLGRRAHVIGGAGRGADVMRRLVEAGYDVSAGVLHASDTDATVAERLNLVRVSVAPFSPIDGEAAAAGRELVLAAHLVVVCDAPFGPGNLENLRLAQAAVDAGVEVVLLERIPIRERDFTDGEATALWNGLRERARIVSSYEELAPELR
jgi:iron complex transport system ATP-binding protein